MHGEGGWHSAARGKRRIASDTSESFSPLPSCDGDETEKKKTKTFESSEFSGDSKHARAADLTVYSLTGPFGVRPPFDPSFLLRPFPSDEEAAGRQQKEHCRAALCFLGEWERNGGRRREWPTDGGGGGDDARTHAVPRPSVALHACTGGGGGGRATAVAQGTSQ